jgi:glycine oxidase
VLFPEVMTIRPDLAARALLEGIDVQAGQVEDPGELRRRADLVVIAAGAWAGPLLAQAGVEVQVAPRRGQMMLFDRGELPHVLLSSDSEEVAVPRSDGCVLVGTTLEDVGFDAATEPATLERLEGWARRMVPGLGRRVDCWAGLRPWSDRDLPTIARVADDVIAATGHFRNGLLLAPVTAERVVQLAYSGGDSPGPVRRGVGAAVELPDADPSGPRSKAPSLPESG